MPSPRFLQIRDRLPSLWRPEDGDTSLLTRYLLAAAERLEHLNAEATDVMQAHWFAYADQALFSPFYRRLRQSQAKPVPPAGDPELARFPYVSDLARLGSLLGILPWGGPPARRETVEPYRKRIARIVALYRDGLGTVNALAEMVLAQLPDDPDQPFTVEEFPPAPVSTRQAATRGAPDGVVGPLMRWRLGNSGLGGLDGLDGAIPTVYVQGVEPRPGETAATESPLIELYAAGSDRLRLGIAYDGTLAPGETLRLRPAYSFWTGGDGIRRALSVPGDDAAANPTAPGPWQAVEDGPEAVTALVQGRDRTVWAATEAGALWRFDGREWAEELTGLPALHCLALDGDDLLAGTEQGLLRIPLHPAGGGALAPRPAPDTLAGPAVHALLQASDGRWWLGTAEGAARLGPGDALDPLGLEVPVHALHQDAVGTVYLGTELGLFQFQPGPGHWYWYAGEDHSDQVPDWQRFFPEAAGGERNPPAPGRVFLPPVRSIRRGPDASLWLGTDHGIARYFARSAGGPTYTTLLEALPGLATGRVSAIEEDARGALWFATEGGLLRYDGRDWWRGEEGEGQVALTRLGPMEKPKKPVFWRFHRGFGVWQHLDSSVKSPSWLNAAPPPVPAGPAVHALLWTDQAVADLGTWDVAAAAFTRTGDAPGRLRMRYKPDELRIVFGGLPAVPRLPAGSSVWRYLSLEPDGLFEPRSLPAWTIEGRLLPPPGTDRPAPEEGRYGKGGGRRLGPGKERRLDRLDLSAFDDAVFAYLPAARVWFAWEERRAPAVLVRLQTTAPGETIEPAVLDRVWQGIQQVRPAGVRALLAVDEAIVRGA